MLLAYLFNRKKASICMLLATFIFSACDYDNYDPPQIFISGQLQYQGEPLQFDGYAEGTGLSKIVELYQDGFGKSGVPITASVNTNGRFQQQIFAGDYKITMKNTPYPFTFDNWGHAAGGAYDTLRTKITSDYALDIPVTPYFIIEDVQTEVSGTNLVAHFRIKRIQEGASLVKAKLFVNTSSIVNSATPVMAEVPVTDISEPITVSASIPDYRNRYTNNFRTYAFLRIALETDKSPSYFLWSPVYKVENVPLEFNDVSEQYLKNYKQPFVISSWINDRRGIVQDWQATDAIRGSMYDGWGDRLFMSAENWGGSTLLTGSVWQSTKLPAGKYILIAKRGWNNGDLGGRSDRAFVVVAQGESLPISGDQVLGRADCGLPQNKTSLSVNFELSSEQTISLGYAVNFPAKETNAVSFVSFNLIRID